MAQEPKNQLLKIWVIWIQSIGFVEDIVVEHLDQ